MSVVHFLDHIGIACADVPALSKLFAILGLKVDHSEPVPEQGVTTHFLPVPPSISNERTQLELLEPQDPEGTIAKFLQKRGPGIHHLSFRLQAGKLDPICQRLRAEGYRLTYDEARPGAHRMRVNFIHPQSAGGMLIELMESAPERG